MGHYIKFGGRIKALISLATSWLTIYPVLFFILFIAKLRHDFSGWGGSYPIDCNLCDFWEPVTSPLVIVFSILTYCVLVVLYVSHIIGNTTVSIAARALWAIGIIFLPIITMPTYYVRHIRSQDQPLGSGRAA